MGIKEQYQIIKKQYQAIKDKALLIFVFSDLHATKATLVIAELSRSIGLFCDSHTFDRMPYAIEKYLIPNEHIWATFWLALAAGRFYILATGKYHTHFAIFFNGISFLFWMFTTTSIYLSVSSTPSSAGSSIALTCAALWVYVRTGWIPEGMRRKYDTVN